MRKLITHEHDADAAESIRDAVLEMDRIEVAMETVSICSVAQYQRNLTREVLIINFPVNTPTFIETTPIH